MSTQAVINDLRSVMFDVAVWQDKIVTQVGGQIGPVIHDEGDQRDGRE